MNDGPAPTNATIRARRGRPVPVMGSACGTPATRQRQTADDDQTHRRDDRPDKGVAFNAVTGEDTVPVYRLYNPRTGQHLLTMSRVEYDHLGRIGWNKEGEAFRVDPNGAVDVYRVYNPNTGEHLWTSDRTEYEHLGTIGWQLENVAWKGTNA